MIKILARIGLLLAIMGIVFSIGVISDRSSSSTEMPASGTVEPLSNIVKTIYLKSVEYDIKAIIGEETSMTFKIWNTNDLIDKGENSIPLLSKDLFGTATISFMPDNRGYYTLQLINHANDTEEYSISTYQHPGLQKDYLVHTFLISFIGLVILTISIILNRSKYGTKH